ncbi:MAG: putative DNA binding domain-containing protein [Methylococcaceae bacterium]|nr:putative DNA binding domain-containing protein [Methylococcaceae bacterium]
MLAIDSLEDISALQEGIEIECKLAQGRDSKGSLPKDFWETYSAFANTVGGDVFLGIKEKAQGDFEVAGISNPQKVIDELWTNLSNLEKVSANILQAQHVNVLVIDGHNIIHIHVPQALRTQRPVFIRGNPLLGTYKRLNSTDIKQDSESVRRMLAEQIEDSRDIKILTGYALDDLCLDTVSDYRHCFSANKPNHPWLALDDLGFLTSLGCWRKDRETQKQGLTLAGLLMFGNYPAIVEALPNYMLDYQELPADTRDIRWLDRIVPDGMWSGNLFDFYRKVIRKLEADLKVPFAIKNNIRQDDTLTHQAVREAFVNCLVHADYSQRASIKVVKSVNSFSFRNPGLMRVPIEIALQGGESDCRNRTLQQLFLMIGLGEKAGSGLSKILQGWESQHWRQPMLHEKYEPSEQTLLELHTLSLVPDDVLHKLQRRIGNEKFNQLTKNEILILVTALIENTVDHSRMMSILNIHPHDLTNLFANLVEKDLILQEGSGRGTVYFFRQTRWAEAIPGSWMAARDLDLNSGGSGVSSGGSELSSGGLVSLAESIAKKKRAPKQEVESVIIALCTENPLRLEELEKLLNRSADFLRKDYLKPLIKAKKLHLLFPTTPNHPQQAYIAIKSDNNE